MRRLHLCCWLVALILLGGCSTTPPQVTRTVQINSEVSVGLNIPSERWVVSKDVPDFLVEDQAEHLAHELAAQGKKVSHNQLLAAARKRLGANELFVFNPVSKAHLEIDFSRLNKGEDPPAKRTVANSATYAGDSLAQEEGVSGLSSKNSKVKVHGARVAYRLDADYMHHESKTRFAGVIGFAAPYWFFFYYTDPLQDPRDFQEMDGMLQSLVVQAPGGD